MVFVLGVYVVLPAVSKDEASPTRQGSLIESCRPFLREAQELHKTPTTLLCVEWIGIFCHYRSFL